MSRIGDLVRRITRSRPMRRRRLLAGLALLSGAPVVVFLLLNLVFPLPVERLTRPYSAAVYARDGRLLNVFLSDDGRWRIHTRLEDVSPFMCRAVIAYEDRCFAFHPGVNPFSLLRAVVVNLKNRRIVCGGSTLTMQVARMMEPRERNIASKLIEMFRAFQLELKYSKKQILEFYFNLAPYGGNIEGVAAASYLYFGKSPSVISKGEALSLAVLPKSPTRLRPDLHFDEFWKQRGIIASIAREHRLVDEKEYREVVTEETPRRRMVRPQFVPHFSELVRRAFPKEADCKTTIDWRIQCLAERALRQHLSPLVREGITNGAVVVIDNRTRAVRALVGSQDFDDERYDGQVNGALAPRSPGSALKPFVYGLALDLGLISPRQMLADVPVSYSGYAPVNYDGKYHGGISAAEALQSSLNVPAVNLGARLKTRFYSFLKQGGLTTLTYPEEHYGLPLVLGSCEVRLLELTNLYSTLACGGKYQPYRLLERERTLPPVQLLSEGSAYILGEILSELRRPDLPNCWEFTVGLPRVAWKTGTSFGRRDAWSIGYNPEFTVGVWMGNFSGREADRLVGAEVAAPLLFDIFNALTSSRAWFDRPSSVGVRKVCPLSGMLAGEDCPEPVEELFLYGTAPVKKCDMHQKLFLDEKTGLRLTRRCLEGRDRVEKLAVLWPRDIAMWMKKEGYPVEDIPGYAPDCGAHGAGGPGPVILSPADGSDYYLRADAPLEYQKMLLNASVSNAVNKIFWFIDGQLLISGPPQERVFYYPALGRHKIVCMDDQGSSSVVSVQIHGESQS